MAIKRLRVTVDLVIDENDKRANGAAAAMLRDGEFGRYFKVVANSLSTEENTLRKIDAVEIK